MRVNRKKVLYIAVSSQTGGVPKHILNALQEAKKYGYDISVAVPNDGDYFKYFQKLAVDMLNIELKPYSFRSLWNLYQYVKKNKIGLVHSHGKGAGMYARPLKILCPKIKVVHTFHGIYLEQYSSLFKRIYCVIEHVLKHYTDQFICVSESEKKEAIRLQFVCEERTNVIYNGVALEIFENVSINREKYLKKFGFTKDAYVIGCVARLEKMKGHRYLIDAFAGIVKKYPQCRLLLVGDGPDHGKIEDQIQKCKLEQLVCIAGFRHDVPQLLKFFNCFVSASLKEGMPYTLIEALAAGVPVVATNVIGNRDVIKDGHNGFLVKAKDSKSLEIEIEKLYNHSELYKNYVQNGKNDVKEKFTVQISLDKLFNLYDSLDF